jgi:hypothetical protein
MKVFGNQVFCLKKRRVTSLDRQAATREPGPGPLLQQVRSLLAAGFTGPCRSARG